MVSVGQKYDLLLLVSLCSLVLHPSYTGPGAAAAVVAEVDSRCPGGFMLTQEQLETADRADRQAKAEKARVARGALSGRRGF